MTLGVIGEKLGMTQVFNKEGLAIPVTVIKGNENERKQATKNQSLFESIRS